MKDILKNYHQMPKEKKKLLEILLKEQGIDINSKLILPRKKEGKFFPLSFAQQRLWFLEQLEPESALYIIPSGVKIIGPVNINYLLNGIRIISRRHEILRTRFIEKNGNGYQEVLEEFEFSTIEYDLTKAIDNSEKEIEKIIKNEFTKPFRLSECPLFRVILIKVAQNVNYLLLPMHHIISDNWSTGLLIKELLECYRSQQKNKEPVLPVLDIQYVDYTLWQREWLNSDEIKKQRKFWHEKLIDSNKMLELIPDNKRPSYQTYNGSFELFEIDKNLTLKLEELSKSEGLTIFIIFLAVYQFVLSKYSRQNDINIGVPIANRNRTEIEQLIGFFINTIVFRGKIEDNKTVREYLSVTKKTSLEIYANQDVPFEMIVDSLNLERDMSHTPLFQAMLVLNNAPVPTLELEGLKFEPLDIDTGTSKFDLILSFTKKGEVYNGKFEFNTDVYNRPTTKSIINSIKFVLNEFVEKLDQELHTVNLFDKKRNEDYYLKSKNASFNDPSLDFISKEFENIVKKIPNKKAVTDGSKIFTYSELNNFSNVLAEKLLKNGVKPETAVGIYLDRRIEYIPAILGILKAGGVYVPLDTEYPESRLDYIIKDSDIKTIIISEKYNGSLDRFDMNKIIIDDIDIPAESADNLSVKLYPENAAYIIYTSGSTGMPKGVVVEHSKITSHIKNVISEFEISSEDKYLAFATFNFDASFEQIFVPLLAGAEIYLRGNDYWLPSDFINLIRNENITVINPPTVYWNQFVSEIIKNNRFDLDNLKLVIAGGSEMRTDLLNSWNKICKEQINLINAYGPTETIITSSIFKTREKSIDQNTLHTPIGRSIGDREVYVIDKNGKILPPNIPGELCFGSDLLARGYQNNPSLTAEKFIPDNFSNWEGSRLYLTGDLVRYDENGLIEYLGRIDNQVKIRGYRIELGEIEKVLLKHPDVSDAVVIVNSVNEEDKSIIAYIVSRNEKKLENDLIEYCKEKLPRYMIPSHIITIERIPLTTNGKLERTKLPKPSDMSSLKKSDYIAPRSGLESEIANIVGQILEVEKVGVKDNFFELGGHSILAIKVVSKLRENFGVELQLKNLFENPTVEGLSSAIIIEQSKLIDDEELDSLFEQIEKMQ